MKSTIEQILVTHLHRLDAEETGAQKVIGDHKPYKLAIFDIYGTLLISGTGDVGATGESNGLKAFKETMSSVFHVSAAHDVDPIRGEIEIVHQKMKNSGVSFPEVDILKVWQAVLEKEDIGFTEEQKKQAVFEYECRLNPVWPMPGLSDLLSKIKNTSSFEAGIVSNAQFYTPVILEYFLKEPLTQSIFNPAICTFSYTIGEAKPSEKMFASIRNFAKENRINPDEVLYIGNDMLKDVYTASLNGYDTALFAGDARSLRLRKDDERCENLNPTHVITHLDQLHEILF